MSDNRRSANRHAVSVPATLVVNGETYPRVIQNLSLGGAQLGHDTRLPIGSKVELSFSIPTQKEPISVKAAVRWSEEEGLGIQFEGLRARDVWSLGKYFEGLHS